MDKSLQRQKRFAAESSADDEGRQAGVLIPDSSDDTWSCRGDARDPAPVVMESTSSSEVGSQGKHRAALDAVPGFQKHSESIDSSDDEDASWLSGQPGEAVTIVRASASVYSSTTLPPAVERQPLKTIAIGVTEEDVVVSSQADTTISCSPVGRAARSNVATPSQHLGSLHLSGVSCVGETLEDREAAPAKAPQPGGAIVVPLTLTPSSTQTAPVCDGEDSDPYRMLENTQISPSVVVGLVTSITDATHRSEHSDMSPSSFTLLKPLLPPESVVRKVKEWQHSYCAPPGSSMSSSEHSYIQYSSSGSDVVHGHDTHVATIATVALGERACSRSPASSGGVVVAANASFISPNRAASPVKSQELYERPELQEHTQPVLALSETQVVALRMSPTQLSPTMTSTQLSSQAHDGFALQVDSAIASVTASALEGGGSDRHSASIFVKAMHEVVATMQHDSHPRQSGSRSDNPFSFSKEVEDSSRSATIACQSRVAEAVALASASKLMQQPANSSAASEASLEGKRELPPSSSKRHSFVPLVLTPGAIQQPFAGTADNCGLQGLVAVAAGDDDTEVLECSEEASAASGEGSFLHDAALPGQHASNLGCRSIAGLSAAALPSTTTTAAVTPSEAVRLMYDCLMQPYMAAIFAMYLQKTRPSTSVSQVSEKVLKVVSYHSKHEDVLEGTTSTSPATTLSTGYHGDVSSLSKTTSTSSACSASGPSSTEMHQSGSVRTEATFIVRPAVHAATTSATAAHDRSPTIMSAPRHVPEMTRSSLSSLGKPADCMPPASVAASSGCSAADEAGQRSKAAEETGNLYRGVAARAPFGDTLLQLSDLSPVVKDSSTASTPLLALGLRARDGGGGGSKYSAGSNDLFTSLEDNVSANTSGDPVTPDPMPSRVVVIPCSRVDVCSGAVHDKLPVSPPQQPAAIGSAERFVDLPLLNIWERPVRLSVKRPLPMSSSHLKGDREHESCKKILREEASRRSPGGVGLSTDELSTSFASDAHRSLSGASGIGPHLQSASAASRFQEGHSGSQPPPSPAHDRVFARWTDKRFYPGKISSVESDRPSVLFDDGSQLRVKQEDLVRISGPLPPGQHVHARLSDGYYAPGVIVAQEPSALSPPLALRRSSACFVKLDNDDEGATTRCEQREISLDLAQVMELRKRLQEQSIPVPGTEVPSVPAASPRGGSTPLTVRRTTPRCTSTPAHRRKEQRRDAMEVSSLFPDVRESPRRPRPPQKKRFVRGLLGDNRKGPLPPAGSSFLAGCTFLLTHVNKSEEIMRKEQQLMLAQPRCSIASDDSEGGDDDTSVLSYTNQVPYDREHLRLQIEAAGGVVLERFTSDAGTAAASGHCFLVSDTFQRTLKYLQCLAAGVPCVSSAWIRQCCLDHSRVDHTLFLLPAGICIRTRTLCELSGRKELFARQRFVLSCEGSHKKFSEEWTSILSLAGANVLAALPANATSRVAQPCGIVIVVVDAAVVPSPSLVQNAATHGAIIVTTEWVIQCLITGTLLAFDCHEKFAPSSERPS